MKNLLGGPSSRNETENTSCLIVSAHRQSAAVVDYEAITHDLFSIVRAPRYLTTEQDTLDQLGFVYSEVNYAIKCDAALPQKIVEH
jgi:hypothetical protein